MRRVVTTIALIWAISALISIPPLIGWNDWPSVFDDNTPCKLSEERSYVVYSASGSFFIPLVIMTVVYIKIFKATRRRLRDRAKASAMANLMSANSKTNNCVSESHRIDIESASDEKTEKVVNNINNKDNNGGGGGGGDKGLPPQQPLTNNNRRPSLKQDLKDRPLLLSKSSDEHRELKKHSDDDDDDDNDSDNSDADDNNHQRQHQQQIIIPTGDEFVSQYNTTTTTTCTSGDGLSIGQSVGGVGDGQQQQQQPTALTTPTTKKVMVCTTVTIASSDNISTGLSSESPDPHHNHHQHHHQHHYRPKAQSISSELVVTNKLLNCFAIQASKRRPMDSNNSDNQSSTAVISVKRFWEEKQKISLSRERRATRILGIVMGVFVACWLPFFLMYVIMPFCGSCYLPKELENFITWLGYINSALNPLIYCGFNRDFRKAFQKIICCRK